MEIIDTVMWWAFNHYYHRYYHVYLNVIAIFLIHFSSSYLEPALMCLRLHWYFLCLPFGVRACVYTCACTSVRVGVVRTRISALTRLFGRLQWLLQKRNKDYCLAHTKTIFTVFARRKTSTTTQRQRRRGNGTTGKKKRENLSFFISCRKKKKAFGDNYQHYGILVKLLNISIDGRSVPLS